MSLTCKPRAVVLLSGGLDSATCLALAQQKYDCYALSFAYGQRHNSELAAASRLAQALGAKDHRISHWHQSPVRPASVGPSAPAKCDLCFLS